MAVTVRRGGVRAATGAEGLSTQDASTRGVCAVQQHPAGQARAPACVLSFSSLPIYEATK